MTTMHPPREIRFCRSADGVELAMALYGSGPPLVKAATWLTHVESDHASPFERAMIAAVSPYRRFVTYDARGCGLSQRQVEDVSMDAWLRDLEAVVDDQGLERFALLGISQGAAIAVAYAARYPERVSQLVLLGGFATSYLSAANPDPRIAEEAQTLIKLVELGWGSASPAFRQVFVSRFLPDATAEQWRIFDDLQKATATPQMAARYLRTMFSVSVKAQAQQIRCPTLVMHVKGDQTVRFEQGRRLAALIPNARFVPLPGNNHVPFESEAAWTLLVQEMRAFLGIGATEVATALPSPRSALTARQLEVLARVAAGQTDKQIARALQLSPRTVEMHVAGAMKALGGKTRAEAVRQAAQQGLLPP